MAMARAGNHGGQPVPELGGKDKSLTKLHLGCGPNAPEGWINVDGSWTARLAKFGRLQRVLQTLEVVPPTVCSKPWMSNIVVHDLRSPLPFDGQSMVAIYGSHVLEHLYLEEGRRLLEECFRVLRSGGILRVVVPDLETIVNEYMETGPAISEPLTEGGHGLSRADRLNFRLMLRRPAPPTGNVLYRAYTLLKDFHTHKWMYDAESLTVRLATAGFVCVKEMGVHDSRIDAIHEIEEPSRLHGGAGVCIEGLRP